MPPYLRLGSIPRKRHIAHPQQPGFRGEGIYYEEVVTLAGFSAPTASSITSDRRRASFGSSRPGGCARSRRRADAAPSSPQDRDHPPGRRPDHRPHPAARQRRRHPRTLPAGEPQAELFRNADADEIVFVHSGRGHAAHDVRPAAVSRVRLHRHPPLHDLSAGFRPGLPARPARHRGDGQRIDPRPVPQPGRPGPSRGSLQRARPPRPARAAASSTARKRRRC